MDFLWTMCQLHGRRRQVRNTAPSSLSFMAGTSGKCAKVSRVFLDFGLSPIPRYTPEDACEAYAREIHSLYDDFIQDQPCCHPQHPPSVPSSLIAIGCQHKRPSRCRRPRCLKLSSAYLPGEKQDRGCGDKRGFGAGFCRGPWPELDLI